MPSNRLWMATLLQASTCTRQSFGHPPHRHSPTNLGSLAAIRTSLFVEGIIFNGGFKVNKGEHLQLSGSPILRQNLYKTLMSPVRLNASGGCAFVPSGSRWTNPACHGRFWARSLMCLLPASDTMKQSRWRPVHTEIACSAVCREQIPSVDAQWPGRQRQVDKLWPQMAHQRQTV